MRITKRFSRLIPIFLVGFILGTSHYAYAETTGTGTSQSTQAPSSINSNSSSLSASPSNNQSSTSGKASTSVLPATTPASGNGVDAAIANIDNGKIVDIQPIPLQDAVAFVKRKLGEIYNAGRELSVPYAMVVLALAGLVMMMPFKPHLKKYMGFSILGAGLVGFMFIHFGPVIIGVIHGLVR